MDRVVLPEVDSTSAEAARRALATPTWIMAHRQTAGRGRRGRAWAMPKGNFAASLVWRPGGDPAAMALRSFVAALALRDALVSLGVAGLTLKWPNDVLLDDSKLAGILLESPAPGLLVLGVGVNLIAVPEATSLEPGAVPPISLLSASGLRVEPAVMLDALAPAFAARDAQFLTWGFAPIRTAWLDHAARLGRGITVRLPGETLTGIFRDLDTDGCLVLDTGHGLRRIAAGDVFFGEPQCS